MSELYAIRQWPASFYQPATKRWVYGIFQVGPGAVTFEESSEDCKSKTIPEHKVVRYDTMSAVKKATSTFVYSSLVITTEGQDFWFSSFPNRDSVYNVILHFWKHRLLDDGKPKRKQGTRMGQELLDLTRDSENTLKDSAQTLQRQREQLDYASSLMYDIHSDLDVVEKVINHMDSWLGRWRVPTVSTFESLEIVNKQGIPLIHEFPVLLSRPEDPRVKTIYPINGTFRISGEGITILDDGMKNVHHYRPKDISVILIKSPWELVITKYQIGQADFTFIIVSTQLIHVITILEKLYHQKIQREEPPASRQEHFNDDEFDGATRQESYIPKRKQLSPGGNTDYKEALGFMSTSPPKTTSWNEGDQAQLQANPSKQLVNDSEADELCDMVSRMKAMAVDIQLEQDRQFETIDKLTETVENADMRIKANTRRVNSFM